MRPWKRLDSQLLIEDQWMRLTADRCELPSGHVLDRYYVIHEPDWVHVFARDADGRVLVVKQYRYAADDVCVELPGGVIDAGEQPQDAARRELLEETGHAAAGWTKLGWMYANPARQTNRVHVFLATGLQPAQLQKLDASEDIEFGFMTIGEIVEAIDSGRFSQALHIASFYRGRDHVPAG